MSQNRKNISGIDYHNALKSIDDKERELHEIKARVARALIEDEMVDMFSINWRKLRMVYGVVEPRR